ncbi:hypothetical protein MARINOS108_10011 [Marinoscillum sp. 108]|nr:hypothetical protein MARINOS108_10011 [Marinoscillum sp. 108]
MKTFAQFIRKGLSQVENTIHQYYITLHFTPHQYHNNGIQKMPLEGNNGFFTLFLFIFIFIDNTTCSRSTVYLRIKPPFTTHIYL